MVFNLTFSPKFGLIANADQGKVGRKVNQIISSPPAILLTERTPLNLQS
jgi:hypothetical protein